jgi:predicted transglutaminase-like cysteine proteinase
MGIGAGARVFARVLSIALALAAAPDRAEAVSEAAGARIAAPPSPPAPVSRVEPFAWTGPVPPASLADAERWRAVAQAVATDRAMLANCRLDSGRCPPAARRLLDIVEAARAKEGRARLGEVNRAVNLAIAYASDLLRYAMPDVWSAPLATFASGRGDCTRSLPCASTSAGSCSTTLASSWRKIVSSLPIARLRCWAAKPMWRPQRLRPRSRPARPRLMPPPSARPARLRESEALSTAASARRSGRSPQALRDAALHEAETERTA